MRLKIFIVIDKEKKVGKYERVNNISLCKRGTPMQ